MKLLLYNSFGEGIDAARREFEMSFPKDPASIEGARCNESICVEMVQGPLAKQDRKFFLELLGCDLIQESIVDVLLLANGNKLCWIKYSGSFNDGSDDDDAIEPVTVTVARGNIRGIKYCDEFLLMLDDLSILSVFYYCATSRVIRKKEILLVGSVKCFRFHQNMFIYSNLEKVTSIDASKPDSPKTHSVDLKGIVCFTVVTELNAIIAICHNQMFYYLPIQSSSKHGISHCHAFEEIEDSDIENIPSVAKFLENEERRLESIERRIKEAQNLKMLMQHLKSNRDFKAGEATIKFHKNFPEYVDEATVCRVTDQKLGAGFIEVTIEFHKILAGTAVTIIFSRQTPSSTLTRMVKVESTKTAVRFILPAESTDDPKNKMSLELSFAYNCKSECRQIIYPLKIKKVIALDGPRIKLKDDLNDCVKHVENMKM